MDDKAGAAVLALVERDHDALVPALKDQELVRNAADDVETVGDHRGKDVLNGLAKRHLAPRRKVVVVSKASHPGKPDFDALGGAFP